MVAGARLERRSHVHQRGNGGVCGHGVLLGRAGDGFHLDLHTFAVVSRRDCEVHGLGEQTVAHRYVIESTWCVSAFSRWYCPRISFSLFVHCDIFNCSKPRRLVLQRSSPRCKQFREAVECPREPSCARFVWRMWRKHCWHLHDLEHDVDTFRLFFRYCLCCQFFFGTVLTPPLPLGTQRLRLGLYMGSWQLCCSTHKVSSTCLRGLVGVIPVARHRVMH